MSPEPDVSQRTIVHVLRHGAVENPRGVLYGRLPGFGLSALGHRMAHVVAEHLRDHDIAAVIASPLQRAQETAAPVAALHGLTVGTDERLIEAGNSFEGQVITGAADLLRNPGLLPRLANPLRPSWGEPYAEIAERMLAAVAAARDAGAGHEVVLVSHQLPIWMLRSVVEGRRLWHDPRKRQCGLASLTTLTYDGGVLESVSYSEPAAAMAAAAKRAR